MKESSNRTCTSAGNVGKMRLNIEVVKHLLFIHVHVHAFIHVHFNLYKYMQEHITTIGIKGEEYALLIYTCYCILRIYAVLWLIVHNETIN